MYPVVEPYRARIAGGTWTTKIAGNFEEGDPKKVQFVISGSVEVKELGGQLKLFCKSVQVNPRKKKKKPVAEDEETKDEDAEDNEARVAELLQKINDESNSRIPQMYLYLSKKKPKFRMPDIHNTGVRLSVKGSSNGAFGTRGSVGNFAVVLRDVPEVLSYAGLVAIKLPEDEPKTDEPVICGYVEFKSAKMLKIHSLESLGLTNIADSIIKATGSLDSSHKPKKNNVAKDKLKHLSYYRRTTDIAWSLMNLDPDEELTFEMFKHALEVLEIVMIDTQAKRAFDAVDVQGDGMMGASEFENFLMLYDIMGHLTDELLVMDIYETFKMVPSEKMAELGTKTGMDYSAYIEGLDMLDVKIPQGSAKDPKVIETELKFKKTFMAVAKIKEPQIESTYLLYEQWKQAWLLLADHPKELVKRKLVPMSGTFVENKNRERLGRYTQDQEDAYNINLRTINNIVDNIKREHRIKSDERKLALSAWKEHLNLEADKFKAIRGMEKRLLIKKEQEEKSKKRIEEKLLRNKLLTQQAEAKRRQEEEINNKRKQRAVKDMEDVRARGWDRIDLSVQKFRHLAKEFYDKEDARIQFNYCEIFDLSRNFLEDLPDKNFFEHFLSLKFLKLSQNRLRVLPEDIRYCQNIQFLDIDSNRLLRMPLGICSLISLQRLDISNNQLTELPEDLGLCADIRRFNVHSNNLVYLPASLSNCAFMEYMDVSRNKISELPEEFEFLQYLTHLDVSSNRLGHLLHKMGKMEKLVHLNAADNSLSYLPESFGNLKKLEFCNLENNEILLGPGCFNTLTNLKHLLLGKNSIRNLFGDLGNCTSLERIDLQDNRLCFIPSEFGLLSNLQELRLSRNELTSLPVELGALMQLQRLEVAYNKIEGSFIESIGLVTSLRHLDISFNKIDELPRSIIGLKQLISLNAERNRLCQLPDTFTFLDSLHTCNVRNNKFTRFPIELSRMKMMKCLDLANNGITLLPKNINLMTSLDTLNLSRNGLRALPVEFTDVLESIAEVNLSENPWTDLPPRWGKLWPNKHATSGSTGYEVAEAVDFLYGMRVIYDTVERIWEELGAFHYSNRLNFNDFISEIRNRIPHLWEDSLLERAKFLYFSCKEKGFFPRWYVLSHDIKSENESRALFDAKKRSNNVSKSKIDVEERKAREEKSYHSDLRRRVQRKEEMIAEHAINEDIKMKMEMLAIQHCAQEREALAEERYRQREINFNQKDREEMLRLVELLDADKDERDQERSERASLTRKSALSELSGSKASFGFRG